MGRLTVRRPTTIDARWMEVPAPEAVKTRLAAALAELHTEAGWCRHDSGVDGTGCVTRALRLAGEGDDPYGIANATWRAGLTLVRTGRPSDALKLFQLRRARLGGFAPGKSTPAAMRAEDPRIPTIAARLARSSATAYALLGNTDQPPAASPRRTMSGRPAMRSSTRPPIVEQRGFISTWPA